MSLDSSLHLRGHHSSKDGDSLLQGEPVPFLAQPTLDLTQYRGSTQDAYVPKSSWVVMRNRVSCSVWIYLPMGQARLDCSGFSLRGYICTEWFSRAGGSPSFKWQDSGIPTSKVYSDPTRQLPSGMACSCMWKHLLHL